MSTNHTQSNYKSSFAKISFLKVFVLCPTVEHFSRKKRKWDLNKFFEDKICEDNYYFAFK